jgi:FkbM family methyltransferase
VAEHQTGIMKTTRLSDGQTVYCLNAPEAHMLNHHIDGYFKHGIHLEADSVVIDVGANIGLFSLRIVRAYPGARVLAFEPIPAIFHVLEQNVREHGDNRITIYQAGVGAVEGELTFTFFPRSPALSTAHPEFWETDPLLFSKAVQGNLRNAPPSMWYTRLIPSALAGWFARYLRGGAQTVTAPILSLERILREQAITRVDLLKIDAEGAELDVLRGISPADWAKVQQVVLEAHDVSNHVETILNLLTSNGLSQIVTEREPAFEGVPLINIYAHR